MKKKKIVITKKRKKEKDTKIAKYTKEAVKSYAEVLKRLAYE